MYNIQFKKSLKEEVKYQFNGSQYKESAIFNV